MLWHQTEALSKPYPTTPKRSVTKTLDVFVTSLKTIKFKTQTACQVTVTGEGCKTSRMKPSTGTATNHTLVT